MEDKRTLSLEPKITYLGTFRPEFVKSIVMFEINTFGFVKMQSFILNKKNNLGPKLSYLGTFVLGFEKSIVVIQISTLKFVKVQRFMKLEPKSPCLGIFELEFEKPLCHFFKLGRSTLSKYKGSCKTKNIECGTKFPLFMYYKTQI